MANMCLNITSNNRAFNATFVGATKNAEKTLFTPGVVPGVDADPVWSTVVNTPADHLDGVTTKTLARLVLVDTTSVGFEVFVDGHGDGDGTLFHDFLLDVFNTLDGVGTLGVLLVTGIRSLVAGFRAGTGALWSLVFWKGVATNHAWWWGYVVSARWESIWLATVASANIGVVTTSGDTGLDEPVPGTGWLTTVAAHGERAGGTRAAVIGIFGGEEGLVVTGGDAVTIVEGFSGGESPARSAIRLITNVADDTGTVGPVFTSIETFWDGSNSPAVGLL